MPDDYTISMQTETNPLKCLLRHIGTIENHSHDLFEIDMILSGSCRVTVGNKVFTVKTEDVFSIEAGTAHSFAGSDCSIISVQFNQSYFERTLPSPKHPNFECNSALSSDSYAFSAMRKLIARLVKNNSERRIGYELRNWALVYEIMDVMYQNFRIEESEAQNRKVHRYAERIREISQIIGDNYQQNFSLSDLAEKVHLSVSYLSKFFTDQFGINFSGYLSSVRLDRAVERLLETEDNIETISADSGFPNSQAFVQAFKERYGQLPSVYRRDMRAKQENEQKLPEIEQHDYMASLKRYLGDAPEDALPVSMQALRIEFDSKKELGTLKHKWKKILAVSSAEALLISDIQDQVLKAQEDIRFEYIKFNGILSDEMHLYSERNGQPVYSFAYVDKVFNFIRRAGLKPFVQLSFMPADLAKSERKLFGYLVSEPKDLDKWEGLIQALTEHLIKKYGINTVKEWLFSVWEQPDTPDFMYGFSSLEKFNELYKRTWQAVKSIDRSIRVGAPSSFYIVREDFENWYLPFFRWCDANGCPPDFMNFHYYDTVLKSEGDTGKKTFGFASSMVLNDKTEGLNDFVNQVIAERHRLLKEDKPIYLTEWNNTPSQQDLLNDTCFKSCYIAKGILENYDKLDSFAYWSLSDLMGEAPQPEDLYFGGLGLFTSEGIPKASYQALVLISKLGDTFMGRGPGWFAAKDGDSYQILLYNYKHFSNLYAMGERFDMTFTDRYTPFSPEQPMDVHIVLSGMKEGEYVITETSVSRKSGSSFDQWIEMGGMELTEKEELDTLKAKSLPAMNKYVMKPSEHGNLRLDAILDMLEVRLIRIKPK